MPCHGRVHCGRCVAQGGGQGAIEADVGQIDDDKFYRLLKEVKPRGNFRYSNLHYTLLGRVIEAVDGERWPELLKKEVLLPAGMTRTGGFLIVGEG